MTDVQVHGDHDPRALLERYAWHESGHVAVAELLGQHVVRVTISADGGGQTEVDLDGLEQDPRGSVLVHLAGAASELSNVAAAGGDLSLMVGSDHDIRDAIVAARALDPADPISLVQSMLPDAGHCVDATEPRIRSIALALMGKVDAAPDAGEWSLSAAELQQLPGRPAADRDASYGPESWAGVTKSDPPPEDDTVVVHLPTGPLDRSEPGLDAQRVQESAAAFGAALGVQLAKVAADWGASQMALAAALEKLGAQPPPVVTVRPEIVVHVPPEPTRKRVKVTRDVLGDLTIDTETR